MPPLSTLTNSAKLIAWVVVQLGVVVILMPMTHFLMGANLSIPQSIMNAKILMHTISQDTQISKYLVEMPIANVLPVISQLMLQQPTQLSVSRTHVLVLVQPQNY